MRRAIWRIILSIGKSDNRIEVNGTEFPLEVRYYARARTYRLRYDANAGVLRLSVPARANLRKAIAWAQQQQEWLHSQIAKTPKPIVLRDGAVFPYCGADVRIAWSANAPRAPVLEGEQLHLGGASDAVGKRVQRWLKDRARLVLSAESHDMAEGAGLTVSSVAIGDPRSRWGSCSSGGALRYSWRLILAPPDVRRAIVAHEVAHLVHMNHSPDFHSFHAELLGESPDAANHWLRKHGASLHRITAG
jgi:predicted metal-dependent hydrolase